MNEKFSFFLLILLIFSLIVLPSANFVKKQTSFEKRIYFREIIDRRVDLSLIKKERSCYCNLSDEFNDLSVLIFNKTIADVCFCKFGENEVKIFSFSDIPCKVKLNLSNAYFEKYLNFLKRFCNKTIIVFYCYEKTFNVTRKRIHHLLGLR